MNKKDLFVYLRGLLTFVIFASAITWFYFYCSFKTHLAFLSDCPNESVE